MANRPPQERPAMNSAMNSPLLRDVPEHILQGATKTLIYFSVP
jgi:hypothetical protein